ncbi:MAG: WG repeat-containing protein [Pseudoflavonifractor sp.]|nr:WG repeat-containing protein [Pseudoflavonifractor sp.]
MRSIKAILTILVTVMASDIACAKTATWAISPRYDELVRYHSDIFAFRQGGKWGLVKFGNVEILPASYEYITPFVNGYALAGIKEGSRYLLQAVISESGKVSTLRERLYLPSSNQYFSEGKLAVSDRSGKYGYIYPSGVLAVRCQFDRAFPFKEGFAPVKQGNYFKYITDNYDRNPSGSMLVVDFHYGDMTSASCFSGGCAAVGYNKDFALIGVNGKKIRKLSESEFRQIYKNNNAAQKSGDSYVDKKTFSEFSENGLYGLRQGNELVVKPQFDSFPFQYADGYVVAAKAGKQGLLTVVDGNYDVAMKSASGSRSRLDVGRKGNVENVTLNITAPASHNNLSLKLDNGDGIMRDVSSQLSFSNGKASLSVTPSPKANVEKCRLRAVLESEGLTVAEAVNDFELSYPIRLRVTQPRAVSSKADENDNVTIYAVIYNDSNKAVTVTATLSAKQTVSHTYTIQPGGSARISVTEKITVAQHVSASVVLSSGEKAGTPTPLYLEPYF